MGLLNKQAWKSCHAFFQAFRYRGKDGTCAMDPVLVFNRNSDVWKLICQEDALRRYWRGSELRIAVVMVVVVVLL